MTSWKERRGKEEEVRAVARLEKLSLQLFILSASGLEVGLGALSLDDEGGVLVLELLDALLVGLHLSFH